MEFPGHDRGEEDKKDLVRRFSEKWNQDEPINPLALGLAVVAQGPEDPAEVQESFKSLYQGSGDDGLVDNAKLHLEESSESLKQIWDAYFEEKKIDEKRKSDYIFEPKGDDIFTEFAAHIQSSVEEWKTRKRVFGKARDYAISCCETLSNHSNFFSIVPSENVYCSLFCGVLKTLVKAGANYKDMGRKLDESIKRINEQVGLCRLDHSLMRTKEISALVIRLYAQVFRLFGLILQYFTSKFTRLLDAFNERSYEEKFGGFIDDIKSITKAIRRRAELGSRAEQRDMHLAIRYMFLKMGTNAKGFKQAQGEIQEMLEMHEKARETHEISINFLSAALSNIGALGQRALIQATLPEGNPLRASSNNRFGGYCGSQARFDLNTPPASTTGEGGVGGKIISQLTERPASLKVSEQLPNYTFHDIQRNAQNIKDLVLRNPLPLTDAEGPTNSGILPEPTVTTALQLWTSTKGPQILWLSGLNGDKQRKSFTNLVEVVVTNAKDFDVNIMYFACDPYSKEYSDSGSDAEVHKRCLLDLVYVLIWQLVLILPDYIQTSGHFSTVRFNALNEEYASLNAAVSLLQDLLDVAPPVAIVMLDGVERLSHPSVERDLKYVLELLMLYAKAPDVKAMQGGTDVGAPHTGGMDKGLKMLLTTVAPCQPLMELYQRYEGPIKQVLVSWKKWHQYGKDVNLF